MIQKFFEFNTAAGYQPFSSICLGGNGKIYGTAQYGGDRGSGALFEFDPNSGSYSKKVDFVFNKTGSAPGGTLMQAANGKLYGLTPQGGIPTDRFDGRGWRGVGHVIGSLWVVSRLRDDSKPVNWDSFPDPVRRRDGLRILDSDRGSVPS